MLEKLFTQTSEKPDSDPINSGKIINNGYIVNKVYDWIWFIGAPLISLLIAFLFVPSDIAQLEVSFDGIHKYDLLELFIGTFIMSHLFIVFFRSHANPEIFKLHPIRFVIIPITLLIMLMHSAWALALVTVIAVWWDVYHSGQQTFGLGRIYDMRIGNSPQAGRRLDYFLNILIYLGPILAGASLLDHLRFFWILEPIDMPMLSSDLPRYIFKYKHSLSNIILLIGIPYILFYIYSYWRLSKQGYIFSTNKVVLLTSTAIVSIFCWGFNSFGEAFFVMNFFHAWQYFAIVWAFEKKNITKIFGLSRIKVGKYISLFLFLFIAFSYGLWVSIYEGENDFWYSTIVTVSVLHFWYDGFIWSVKRKQV